MLIDLIGEFTIDLLRNLPADLLIVSVIAICLAPVEDWFFEGVKIR